MRLRRYDWITLIRKPGTRSLVKFATNPSCQTWSNTGRMSRKKATCSATLWSSWLQPSVEDDGILPLEDRSFGDFTERGKQTDAIIARRQVWKFSSFRDADHCRIFPWSGVDNAAEIDQVSRKEFKSLLWTSFVANGWWQETRLAWVRKVVGFRTEISNFPFLFICLPVYSNWLVLCALVFEYSCY